jgi:dynein heavy chain
LKPLASWVKDFIKRVEMISQWYTEGQPSTFWLPGFFFPQGNVGDIGFLTGVLQNHARKWSIPIDTLVFTYVVKDVDEVVSGADVDGVYISGLFIEGARWDSEKRTLQDSYAMEMFSVL